ncbi:MAG TPA: hypothetical protein PLZ45_08600 [Ferruginibacter sp.]|nr:hypothetical protein [Chitinophagaceae bacterium]HRI24725.1 hypothetical protein [Ferruginibacter sp.]
MKKFFIAAWLCLLASAIHAQLRYKKEISYNSPRVFACNFFTSNAAYDPPPAGNVSEETEMKWMNDIVEKILGLVGLQNKIKLYSFPGSDNCSAVCLENSVGSDRYIVFDRLFLQQYEKNTNKWFVMGVVAHELGHHLNGHTLSGYGSRPDKELEADAFAGFILQKLGASREEAKAMFSFLGENDGPPTHPKRAQRYLAIERGWNEAANKSGYANLAFNEADDGQMAERVFYEAQVQTNHKKKLELLKKAQQLYPKHAGINSELGVLYLTLNDNAMANLYTSMAVNQAPYVGWIWMNRAKYYQSAGNVQAQYNCLDSAIKYKPVLPEAYLMRAAIFESEKQYSLSLENIAIGLAMGPEPELAARLFLQKASVQKAQGLKKEAKESYDTASMLDPFNPVIKLMKGSYD